MPNVATAATRVNAHSQRSSQRRTAVTRRPRRLLVVLLDGLPQVVQQLPSRQPLCLHALYPILFDRLELGDPALALLLRHGVDRRVRFLGGRDPFELVLVPYPAGELGAPGAAQIVD